MVKEIVDSCMMCARCKYWQHLTSFHRIKKTGLLDSYCKKCRTDLARIWKKNKVYHVKK